MKRLAKNIAKLVVVVFPLAVGLFLTNLGTLDLQKATVVPIPKWEAPYGFLVFASAGEALHGFSASLLEISLDGNAGSIKLSFGVFAKNTSTTEEQVVGIQIPYNIEFIETGIEVHDSEGRIIPLEIADRQVMAVGGNTSLAYLKFVFPTEVTIDYWVRLLLNWKDLIVREGFSSYNIMFPIALTEKSVHNAITQHFPNANTFYGKSLGNLSLLVRLPEGTEVKRVYPLPSAEVVEAGLDYRLFSWQFTTPEIELWGEWWGAHSASILVSFEVRQQTELRNRLLFDSGLYMGLGIGLLISGLHEALKYTIEIRRRQA